MKAESSVKQEHIVEAAIRRFSHFGVNKTTLSEIADDIQISKTSLFYYFQDKSSLLEAIARKIIYELLDGFEAAAASAESVDDGLNNLIEVKREFFKKYLHLALQADRIEMIKVSPQLPEVILEAHDKAASLISSLLAKGVQQKELRSIDVRKTSVLVLETMEAFEQGIKCKSAIVGPKDIDRIFDKQKEVVELLINGLKSLESRN